MKINKTPIPIEGERAEYEIPGPVTTWAQMSPEKKAELRALYENRPPKVQIGLKPTPEKRKRRPHNYMQTKRKKQREVLTLVINNKT